MSKILVTSEYQPDYIDRELRPCPHCGSEDFTRTNRYLLRCMSQDCGRYW